MKLNDYQSAAKTTAVFPEEVALSYLTLGLAGEAGEVANKAKKVLRDGANPNTLASELGDVLWYVAVLADRLGLTLEEVAAHNLIKLARRQSAGTLQGNGDDR